MIRLSKEPEFKEIVKAVGNATENLRTNFSKFLQVIVEDDANTPRVAHELALLIDDLDPKSIVHQALLALGEKLFNALTLKDLFEFGKGELRYIHIDRLIPEDNPHDSNELAKLYQNVKGNGLLDPLICISTYPSYSFKVFDGSLRLMACNLLKYKMIPCYVYPYGSKLTRSVNR